MGSIKSFEEVKDEVEKLEERVQLLTDFAEAVDSRIGTIIPTTMKSMSRRQHNLKNDIKKVKTNLTWKILVSLLLISIIVSSVMAIITNNLREEFKNSKNLEVTALQSQMTSYESQLKESANEISQLKDRLVFLSFMPALYKAENSDGIGAEEEPIISELNWKEYINLFTIGQNVPLPTNIDTNTFRCMDYRTITDIESWQYEIQKLSRTNSNGLRVYDYGGKTYYTVALATAYGIDLGNAYEVELENGTIFNIVHAEYKHDIRYPREDDYGDPDVNYDEENTISVIEFVYDWQSAPQRLIDDGEANRFLGENCDIYGDGCNIKRMTYLGKVWNAT